LTHIIYIWYIIVLMIPRYSLPKMSAIWSDENKFQKMLDVEILACEALTSLGKIPKKELRKIKSKAKFDVKRIEKIEKTIFVNFLFCANTNNAIKRLAKKVKATRI